MFINELLFCGGKKVNFRMAGREKMMRCKIEPNY